MKIVESLDEKQTRELHQLYRQEWWSKERTLEETILGLKGSQICIGILNEENSLMGFTRVLTDYIFKAILFDVIVRKDMRGSGAGKAMVNAVLEHPDLKSVKHFELYCRDEMTDFYRKFGFSDTISSVKLMRYIPERK